MLVVGVSGGIVAGKKNMDVFGFAVLALLPAVGGGTLRDLILDVPVFRLEDTGNLVLALPSGIVTFVFYSRIRELPFLRCDRCADQLGFTHRPGTAGRNPWLRDGQSNRHYVDAVV